MSPPRKQVTVFGSGLIGAALTCHFGRNHLHSAPARLLGPHTLACASPLTHPGAVAFALSYRNAAGGDIEVTIEGLVFSDTEDSPFLVLVSVFAGTRKNP